MTAKPPTRPDQPFRLTREQYYKLGELGLFDGKRVELIYGEVVEMSPINWPHHIGVTLVSEALARAFAAGHFVDVQQSFPIPASQLGVAPQPDVAVIPGSPRDYTDHPTVAALIVEVADATLFYDTTTKAELYATANVAEYWVLDVTNRELHVFRDPQPLPLPQGLGATAYKTHLTLGPTDRVSPLAAPAASVLVSDLLP
jgi:Uma2 family endonuclease